MKFNSPLHYSDRLLASFETFLDDLWHGWTLIEFTPNTNLVVYYPHRALVFFKTRIGQT